MNIEKKKDELLAVLAELDAEIKTLSDRIAKAREDLANVYTMDDLQKCLVKLVNAKNSGYVTKKDIADALQSDYKLINNAE